MVLLLLRQTPPLLWRLTTTTTTRRLGKSHHARNHSPFLKHHSTTTTDDAATTPIIDNTLEGDPTTTTPLEDDFFDTPPPLLFPPKEEQENNSLLTRLYSSQTHPQITPLYSASSVQQVLDIINSNPITPELSCQSLVTLWDLQKTLFTLGPTAFSNDTVESKQKYVRDIKQDHTFQSKILTPVLENCNLLDDEPLCAALLSLKKMDFKLAEFEPLVLEALKRKDTLSLPALSRLTVCMRTEGTYGQIVIAEFSELILKYVHSMNSDSPTRLVSILLRNARPVLSNAIINTYIQKIQSADPTTLETVTLCKIFLVLTNYPTTPATHKIGAALATRNLDLMEILSLQKFLHLPNQEPYQLVESLVQKYLRVIEQQESIRLDLLTPIAPFVVNEPIRKVMEQVVMETIDNHTENNSLQKVYQKLYPLLRTLANKSRSMETNVIDKFWNGVASNINDTDYTRLCQISRHYLTFYSNYRNSWLESTVKKYIFTAFNTNVVLTPSDVSTLLAFLVAYAPETLTLNHLNKLTNLISQLKPHDLSLLAKSIETCCDRNSDVLSEISTLLEEECAFRKCDDLTMASKIISCISKMNNNGIVDTPLLPLAVESFTQKERIDSKDVKEMLNILMTGNYFFPGVLERVGDYILKNIEYLGPDTVDKFLICSYMLGWDHYGDDGRFLELFEGVAGVINRHHRHLDLGILQSAIALGFHNELKPDLINKIFNVEFLDHIDEMLLSNSASASRPFAPTAFRTRLHLMELNRITCLDVPAARLPWFHEKFCLNLLAKGLSKPTYLHAEVSATLGDLLGQNAVFENVCLSKDYYYNIDFVLKFDAAGRPIKKKTQRNLLFGRSITTNDDDDDSQVARKIAVLVFPNSAYTKNIRSLKGGLKLKKRHLEILGYQVITIDAYEWNTMYMSEPGVKLKCLENRIF